MNFVELDIKMRVKRAKYGSIPDAIDIELPYPLDSLIIPDFQEGLVTPVPFEFTPKQLSYLESMGVKVEDIPENLRPFFAQKLDELIADYESTYSPYTDQSGSRGIYKFSSRDSEGNGLFFYYNHDTGKMVVSFKNGDDRFFSRTSEEDRPVIVQDQYRDPELMYREDEAQEQTVYIDPIEEYDLKEIETEEANTLTNEETIIEPDVSENIDQQEASSQEKYEDNEIQSNYEHLSNAVEDETLKEELDKVTDELSMAWYDWGVDDGNVENVWQWLQDLYEQDPNDYAYVVIQMKNSTDLDYLERLFDETNYEHIETYYDIITKTSFFMKPTELYVDLQNLAIYEGVAALYNLLGALSKKTKLDEMSKEEVQEFAKENEGVYFDLKLYEIEYYVENEQWDQVASILVETYHIMDMILQLLFVENREDFNNTYLNNPLLMLALEKAYLDKEPSKEDKNFVPKMVNMDHVEVDRYGQPIVEEENSSSSPTGTNTATSGGSTPLPQSPGFVTTFSEKIAADTKTFFSRIEELIEKNPKLLTVIEQVRLSTHKIQSDMLTVPLDTEETEDEKLNFTADVRKDMTWADLYKVWLWEMGDTKLGRDENNPVSFEEGDKTTNDIRTMNETRSAIKIAENKASIGDFTPTELYVRYDKDAFLPSVNTKNIPFIFLGSYKITITPEGTEYDNEVIFNIMVENESGWKSATRFGPEDKDTGMKDPVVENTVRGKSLRIGGTLFVNWKWDERHHIYYQR